MTIRNALLAGLLGLFLLGSARSAEIELVGKASIPGSARDKSGLRNTLKHGIPHDLLGSHGSAIAYTGKGTRYILVDDRGPGDGAGHWFCRFHTFEIVVDPQARTVKPVLLSTTLLRDEKGRNLVGLASEFDQTNSPGGRRFDPEGSRLSRTGTLFVSDEYGPFICEFGLDGRRLKVFTVPPKFLINKPGATPELEQRPHNSSGRYPNKGFEGLAISPEGDKLYAILQGPLIQDHGGAKGRNLRILEMPVQSGTPRELLYPLDAASHGVNEILAVHDTQFLTIERDSQAGNEARFKKLVLIDIRDASDISAVDSLPEKAIPKGIRAVSKKVFLDLLDPAFGLAGPQFPAKIEGLAFGPPLPDGRILLLVTSDNDCKSDQPTWIWAFAIDRNALPGYKPQNFDRK